MAGTRITNHPVTSNLVPHGPRWSTGRSPSGMGNSTFWRLKSLQFIISAISDIHHPNRSGKNKHVKPTMMRMSLFISSLFTAKRCTSSTHHVRPRCRTSSPRASLQRHQVPWQHTSPRCCTPRRPPLSNLSDRSGALFTPMTPVGIMDWTYGYLCSVWWFENPKHIKTQYQSELGWARGS